MPSHEDRAGLPGEVRHPAEIRRAVERHDDVEPFRAGRLDPARQPHFAEQIAQRQRDAPEHVDVVIGRIEIEHAEIGLIEMRLA